MDYKISYIIHNMKNVGYLIFLFCFNFQNTSAQGKSQDEKSIDSIVQDINSRAYMKFSPKEFHTRSKSNYDSTVFYIDSACDQLKKVIHVKFSNTPYRDRVVLIFYYSNIKGIHLVRIDYESSNDCVMAIANWYVKNNRLVHKDGFSYQDTFNDYIRLSNGYVKAFVTSFYKSGK